MFRDGNTADVSGSGLSHSSRVGLIGLLVALFVFRGYAQQYPGYDVAATGASVGVSGFGHFWGNPACWEQRNTFCAGTNIFYPYCLKEMAVKHLGMLIPMGEGSLGGLYSSQGFSLFTEQQVGMGYSRSFGKALSAGVILHYLSLRIGQGYGKASGYGALMGVMIHMSSKVEAGGYTFFPAVTEVLLKESFQPFIAWGIRWKATTNLCMILEIMKEGQAPALVRTGLLYSRPNKWMIQGGFDALTMAYYAGTGISFREFTIILNFVYRSPLGSSPSVSLIYER